MSVRITLSDVDCDLIQQALEQFSQACEPPMYANQKRACMFTQRRCLEVINKFREAEGQPPMEAKKQ